MGLEDALEGALLDEGEGLPCKVVETVEVVLVPGDREVFLRLFKVKDRLEEDLGAFLDELPEGVEVGGEAGGGGEEGLPFLALAFAEELLPPLGELDEGREIGAEELDLLALLVEVVTADGVLIGLVLRDVGLAIFFGGVLASVGTKVS